MWQLVEPPTVPRCTKKGEFCFRLLNDFGYTLRIAWPHHTTADVQRQPQSSARNDRWVRMHLSVAGVGTIISKGPYFILTDATDAPKQADKRRTVKQKLTGAWQKPFGWRFKCQWSLSKRSLPNSVNDCIPLFPLFLFFAFAVEMGSMRQRWFGGWLSFPAGRSVTQTHRRESYSLRPIAVTVDCGKTISWGRLVRFPFDCPCMSLCPFYYNS